MRTKRNIFQIKEQIKSPEKKKKKETEISDYLKKSSTNVHKYAPQIQE